MSQKMTNMNIGELTVAVGSSVAYYPRLAIAVGGNRPGILLCWLLYWYEKGNDEDGWIWKNSDEIEAETGLSYEEQKTARKQLRSTGILEEKYDRLNHRMGFRIDLDRLETVWEETLEKHPDWSRHLHAKRDSQPEPCNSVKPPDKNKTRR